MDRAPITLQTFSRAHREDKAFMTQSQLQKLWLKALVFTLFGYATLGKGFAYLFIGEMILVAGVFIFLRSQRVTLAFSDPTLLLWAAFAFWGFCRTVPFLPHDKFDAIRDSVLWAYGFFALLIAAFINTSDQISQALNSYRKFLRWYLPLVPVLIVLSAGYRAALPNIPWANGQVSVIMLKSGDAAVHLAAAGLFFLLFPDRSFGKEKQGVSVYTAIGFVGWSLAALFVLITTRGGFSAMMVPIILVSTIRAKSVGWKVVALAVAGAVVSLMVLETNLITVKVKGRTFTAEQVSENVASLVNSSDEGTNLNGTKQWRLVWWKHIVDYTVFGPYRWTGKGFGVNLAQQDGPPGITEEDLLLRSPHNGSMTVLARMGVPGILLWLALNGGFALRLIGAYRRTMRSGSRFWSSVNLWILCYWLAAFIDMSFDVYIEGPQGGIWFWSIIGFGVAALRVQAYEARQSEAQSRARLSSEELSLAPA